MTSLPPLHSIKPDGRRSEHPSTSLWSAWRSLQGREKGFILGWCLILLIPAMLMLRMWTAEQKENAKRSEAAHAHRLGRDGEVQAERTPPPGHENDVPREVKVGVYVDRISDFSVVGSTWKVDFFVWFNWEGEDLDPGEGFKVVNGEVLARTLAKKSTQGNRHYALYRASAQITKAFDVSRFPRDSHLLTLQIEDQSLQSYQVVFKADEVPTEVSSRVSVEGYQVKKVSSVVGPHSYKSSMGDPILPKNYKATYSQLTVGIDIERPSWGLYSKMFVALYIAVLLAIGGLFLVTPSERLALAGTALFVAIMNAECNAALVPATGTSTLGDSIAHLGYVAIGVILTQAILYHRFFNDEVRRPVARIFDVVSVVLVTVLYVVLNVGILSAAAP